MAHLHENLLRFNPQLYRENHAHFLEQTVAHEVAHLRHLDHSPRFWDTVRTVVPDYAQLRGQLMDETLPPW